MKTFRWLITLFFLTLISLPAISGEIYEYIFKSASVELKIRISDEALTGDFNIPVLGLDTFEVISIDAPLDAVGPAEPVAGVITGSFTNGVPQLTPPTAFSFRWPDCGPSAACVTEMFLNTAELYVFGGIAFDFVEGLTNISVEKIAVPTQIPVPWISLGILATILISVVWVHKNAAIVRHNDSS